MDGELARALLLFADSCDRLAAAIDERERRDRTRLSKLLAFFAVVTGVCVALQVSGTVSVYETNRVLQKHMLEEAKARNAQLDFNVEAAEGWKNLQDDVNRFLDKHDPELLRNK